MRRPSPGGSASRADRVRAQLTELLALLSRPGTDVSRSSFVDASQAVAVVEELVPRVLRHEPRAVRELGLLLAPTGALQEISLASGWGEEFLRVARRIDALL